MDLATDAGVAEDFTAMYAGEYPRVVRALELAGIERASAEDLAQEAFARTLVHWRRVRLGTNPPGYVYRVAFRLSHRRRPQEFELAEEASRDDTAAQASTNVDVAAVLAAMPPARRRCAVCCLVVGLSPKEAGRALGIAESTVRKQIERARADLRAALG